MMGMGSAKNQVRAEIGSAENQVCAEIRSAAWAMRPPATRMELSSQEKQPSRNRRRTWSKKKSQDQSQEKNWADRAMRSGPPALQIQERARSQQPLRRRMPLPLVPRPPVPQPADSPRTNLDFHWIGLPYVAMNYYNARHPGGEFDIVSPRGESSMFFRDHCWWHINFMARCRNSEESRCRTSCGFCVKGKGILHPIDEFVCANGTPPAEFVCAKGTPPAELVFDPLWPGLPPPGGVAESISPASFDPERWDVLFGERWRNWLRNYQQP